MNKTGTSEVIHDLATQRGAESSYSPLPLPSELGSGGPNTSTAQTGSRAKTFKEVVTFAIVGVTGTGLYAAIVLLLTRSGVDLFVANHLAFLASALWSYFGHRLATFEYGAAHAPAIRRFVIPTGVLYVISNCLLFGVERLKIDIAWAVATIVILNPIVSYLALKFWVFRR